MSINTKNADDRFLRFRIQNASGPDPLQQWVLVEWADDPDVLLDSTLASRTPQNSWPYDLETQVLATVFVTNVPFYMYVPAESWAALKQSRIIYYRLGYGSDLIDFGVGAWTWDDPLPLIINHNPEASAGPPETHSIGIDGRLIGALTLDASGTVDGDMSSVWGLDADPGPLTYSWELLDNPAQYPTVRTLISQSLPSSASSQDTLTILPDATYVPENSLGTYRFKVTVYDTDVPLPSSAPGVGHDEVQHTIQAPTTGLTILSPTAVAPLTFQFSDELDVDIAFQIANDLIGRPELAGGYKGQLTIYDTATGNPVVVRSVPVPTGDVQGHFHWDGIHDNLTPPGTPTLYDIRVDLLDAAGNAINIAGRQTHDVQENSIQLNVTAITIDSPNSTPVIDAAAIEEGTAHVDVRFTLNTPPGAQNADEQVLQISDEFENVVREIALPATTLFATQYTWDGFVQPGPVATTGIFFLRLLAKNAGVVLSRSNRHEIAIVRIRLNIVSPNSVVDGNATNYRIESARPTMPALTIDALIDGLPQEEVDGTPWDLQLEVAYTSAGSGAIPARNDRIHVGATAVEDITIGALATNWFHIDSYQPAHWLPDWGTFFIGGDMTVFWRADVRGYQLTGKTLPGALHVYGENPTKATVRAAFGDDSFYTAMAYQESRYNQFRNSTAAGTLNVYDAGPFTVLRAGDEGYGIGQLTSAPIPSRDMLWNWRSNVAEAIRHLDNDRATSNTSMNNTRAMHAGLPAFTADELNLNAWCRYNSGRAYHVYNPATNNWRRDAHAGADYADTVRGWQVDIDSGAPPVGYN